MAVAVLPQQDALDAPMRKAFSMPKQRGASRSSSPLPQKALLQTNGRQQPAQQQQQQQQQQMQMQMQMQQMHMQPPSQLYVQTRTMPMQQQQQYQQMAPGQYQPIPQQPFKVDGLAELTTSASAPPGVPSPTARQFGGVSTLFRTPSDGSLANGGSPSHSDASSGGAEENASGGASKPFGSGGLFRPMDVSTMMMVQSMQSAMQQMQSELTALRGTVAELQVQLQMAKGQSQTQTAAQIEAKQTLKDTATQLKDCVKEGLAEVKELVAHKDAQQRARLFNSTCSRDRDVLERVPSDAGEMPLRFPATRKDASSMSLDMMQYLFDFYQMPRDPADTLLDRLLKHIGVRL
eukprot:TRINITY_DN26224_c0_g1_i1.p1 TRINITY_DN26224_c0_g1~~TRINITY_DN26224_c0_g1_i1.p1  ORF type:complete len:348 (+),score=21.63 TRINITY_DN26224_c0_g1_i1:133-1176(+)